LKKNIFIASDHGAVELCQEILLFVIKQYSNLYDVIHLGCESKGSVDYPDYADKLVTRVLETPGNLGVLCCGTGIGMSIRANRYPQIRAALVHDRFTAKMAKVHNNANVICMGGRVLDISIAAPMISDWIDSEFESGRHERRLDKLDNPTLSSHTHG